jgi:hypothetical protein
MMLYPLQQRVASQQVEEIVGVKAARVMRYSLLLMRRGFMGTVHVGWRPQRPLFG